MVETLNDVLPKPCHYLQYIMVLLIATTVIWGPSPSNISRHCSTLLHGIFSYLLEVCKVSFN